MGILIFIKSSMDTAFDWLEKGWVRAHTRQGKNGPIQVKAHYDRRTKKAEVPSPRRKARVKEQPPERTHPERAEMVAHAKEIATAIKKIQSGTHDFKLGDHSPEQAVGNLKNQLKHMVSKIQQHKIDHHGGFTAEELKSGLHKKSGKIAEVNGKELHSNFEAKGNHAEFKPEDHAEAAKIHQELAQKGVDLHRGADAGGDSIQAQQHLEAAMHHGAQATMHKLEEREKKTTEKAAAKTRAKKARTEVSQEEAKPKEKAAKTPKLSIAQAGFLSKIRNDPGSTDRASGRTHLSLMKMGMIKEGPSNRPGDASIGVRGWHITDAGKAALDANAKDPEASKVRFEAQQRRDKTNFARYERKFSYQANDPWQISQIENLNKIPEHVFNSVMDVGHEIYIGKGSVVGLDNVKEKVDITATKPGDPRTWNDVGGCYIPSAKKIVVGDLQKNVRQETSLHEFGHAVGHTHKVNGVIAQKHSEFKRIYESIEPTLAPILKKSNPSGSKEVFAECFALLHTNEGRARSLFGDNMVNWMRDNVLTDPNSLAGATVRAKEALAKQGSKQARRPDPAFESFAGAVKQSMASVGGAPSVQPQAGAKAPTQPDSGGVTFSHLMDAYKQDIPSRGGLKSMPIKDTWKRYSEKVTAGGGTPDKAAFDKMLLEEYKKGNIELRHAADPDATVSREDPTMTHVIKDEESNTGGYFKWWAPTGSITEENSAAAAESKAQLATAKTTGKSIDDHAKQFIQNRARRPKHLPRAKMTDYASQHGVDVKALRSAVSKLDNEDANKINESNVYKPISWEDAAAIQRRIHTKEAPAPAKKPLPTPRATESEEPNPGSGKGRGTSVDSGPSIHEVKDRIRKEYKEHAGVEKGKMVRIHELRQRMQDVPKNKLDRAFKDMHDNNEGRLTYKGKASYKTEKAKEDVHSAVVTGDGQSHHKFMLGTEETKPGLKATKKEKKEKSPLAGMDEAIKARSEATQTNRISAIRDRIRQQYKDHGEHILTNEIRGRMPDVSRADFDRAILGMQREKPTKPEKPK